jgi:ketosteroid isomerase-like protein
MKKLLLFVLVISFVSATTEKNTSDQSTRIQELDKFWSTLSKTVKEGDFEGYKNTYHKDAVIIFASGKNKTSVPIEKALAGWKQGFMDTKNGKNKASVEFRFSQRIGDTTTAHETGIFVYKTSNADGSNEKSYPTHFEMLLVKKNGQWLGVMEYQKANATMQEWEALK